MIYLQSTYYKYICNIQNVLLIVLDGLEVFFQNFNGVGKLVGTVAQKIFSLHLFEKSFYILFLLYFKTFIIFTVYYFSM